MIKAVVLISGNGSNLGAIIQQSHLIDIEIFCVISNQADAYGLVRAKNANILTKVIPDMDLEFDVKLSKIIENYQPDLIILAGFMRILTAEFTQKNSGKILNIHPSLLPKFKGLNTHQRVIEAGEKLHGVSVHFVSSQLDSGAIIAQKQILIEPNDTADSLAKKVLVQEHLLYSQVIVWFAKKRLTLNNGLAFLDNKPLKTPVILK